MRRQNSLDKAWRLIAGWLAISACIVPPISLDSSLANVPGSRGEEALNVWEIGRAGLGERKAERPAEAVERAAEDRGGVAAFARGGHRRGEPGGSGRAAGASCPHCSVKGVRAAYSQMVPSGIRTGMARHLLRLRPLRLALPGRPQAAGQHRGIRERPPLLTP